MNDERRDEQRMSPLDRALRLFSDVRAGEAAQVLLLMLDVFLLLVGYYVLKTLREPLILVSAARDVALLEGRGLPEWLVQIFLADDGGGGEARLKAAAAACQALVLLGFIPLYSWFVSRVSRLWLLIGVSGFFIGNLALFYAALLAGVPLVGFVFYVWVGIFSVAMIAQFWSFANDLYSRDAGERLFPIIAIGATAGSPVGSKLSKLLAEWPPGRLVLLTGVILLAYLGISLLVHFLAARSDGASDGARSEEPLRRGGGFALVLRSPYLLGIGLMMLILNLVNTTGEFILTDFVVETARAESPDDVGAWIGAFYGDFFFWVNIVALLLQALVVSRLVRYVGIKAVVLALPFVALGVYGLIGLGVGLAAVRWAKTAENSTDYSIMNTGKALLWLPTTREEKYKGKQTVDTIFVRIGDLFAALLFIVGTTVLDLGVRGLAFVNLGLIAVWIGVALWVLKRHAELVEARGISEEEARGGAAS